MIRTERQRLPRGLELALCVTSLAWAVAAAVVGGRAAQGIALRFGLARFELLLEALFTLFLLVVGLRLLDWLGTRGRYPDQVVALPRREGRWREFAVGAAVGWGFCIAALLPIVLSGNLHSDLNLGAGQGWSTLAAMGLAMASLLVFCLIEELIFRGYAFQRLIAGVGQTWAALAMSVIFALVLQAGGRFAAVATLNGWLFGLLLSMAFLRTNALWVGWGVHVGYRVVAAVIFGLPVAGHGEFGSLMDTSTSGPRWLTGGATGLDGAWLTAIIAILALSVLYRVTRDYAWKYTQPLILPAGYAVEVAPPAAHVAMERAAPPKAPALVQILPVTPQTRSVVEAQEPQVPRG